MKNIRPFLYLILAIFAVSFSAILVRLSGSSPLIIAFYRQAFSALLVLPFLNREEHPPLPAKDYFLLIFSGLFLALHFATWITGLTYTTVARATLLVDLQPLWAAMLGWFILRERVSLLEGAAIALVVAGGAVAIASNWTPGAGRTGDVLALIGGFTGACYFLIGRRMRNEISWVRYMFSVYSFSAAWLLLFSFLLFRSFPLPLQSDLPWIFAMAVIPSLAGHGLFNLAIRQVKGYVVNAAFMGEPVIATVLAYRLFHEKPDAYFYYGAALVFAGLALLFYENRN
jgi:drug/metabolite transporter (DMT)-like permease